jgi:hypothetical protein
VLLSRARLRPPGARASRPAAPVTFEVLLSRARLRQPGARASRPAAPVTFEVLLSRARLRPPGARASCSTVQSRILVFSPRAAGYAHSSSPRDKFCCRIPVSRASSEAVTGTCPYEHHLLMEPRSMAWPGFIDPLAPCGSRMTRQPRWHRRMSLEVCVSDLAWQASHVLQSW